MRNIATYRLEGKLFQRELTRSISLREKTKEAVSLAQVLERPDAISARAKQILSVLLSSAGLHLHGTPWLKPTWSSSAVLFFRITSSTTWNFHYIPTCKPNCHMESCNKLVLLFSAASNRGEKAPPSFPARGDNAIAVYSTDTDGDRSKFSPTAMADELSLATVGEAVESAWLDDRIEARSGTSYATPIMAGIAAFLLQYARLHIPDKAPALKKRKGMKAVLKKIAEKGEKYKLRDDYNFVDVSLYWDGLFGKQKEFIDMTIGNILDSI